AKGDRSYEVAMPHGRCDGLTGDSVPNPRAETSDYRHRLPVGAEGAVEFPRRMFGDLRKEGCDPTVEMLPGVVKFRLIGNRPGNGLTGGRVPDPCCFVGVNQKHTFTIGAKNDTDRNAVHAQRSF